MPLIQWLVTPTGTQVLPTRTVSTASAAATAYMNQQMISSSAWTEVDNATSPSTIAWHGLNQTAANAVYSAMTDTWYYVEAEVTPAEYLSLAQGARRQLEEYARREREMAAQRAHDEREAGQRKAAFEKSRDLLLKHLTRGQRKTFEDNQWFIVQGGASKKTYRIRTTNYIRNIEEMRSERVTHRLCGHLNCSGGGWALHDHHVAQKISLEYDERHFLALCNRHEI
jgi:hypothetical protein